MCLLLSVVSFIQPTSIVMMLSCVVDVNMKKSKMQIVKDNQSKRYCTSTTNGNRNHHHYHYQLLYQVPGDTHKNFKFVSEKR